jgi:hypothetical protein
MWEPIQHRMPSSHSMIRNISPEQEGVWCVMCTPPEYPKVANFQPPYPRVQGSKSYQPSLNPPIVGTYSPIVANFPPPPPHPSTHIPILIIMWEPIQHPTPSSHGIPSHPIPPHHRMASHHCMIRNRFLSKRVVLCGVVWCCV